MIYILIPVLIAFDQITKIWSSNTFIPGGPEQTVGLGFYFTYVKNTGAALGILQDNTLALGILSLLVSAFLVLFLARMHSKLDIVSKFSLVLILAGAVGNMIDRLYLGFVRDFIHFQLENFNFPVFNVADSCVVIGAILLFFMSLRPENQLLANQADANGAEISQSAVSQSAVSQSAVSQSAASETTTESVTV